MNLMLVAPFPFAHILADSLLSWYARLYYRLMWRGKLYGLPLIGVLALTSVSVTWSRTSSSIYPYTIEQPSSFRHLVLRDPALNTEADFYFAPLGGSITNLNVKATTGRRDKGDGARLTALGGQHLRRVAWVHLAGQREPLMRADFKGIVVRFAIEQVTFTARARNWYVSMSYDLKYQKMRPTLLRMLNSFRLK